MKSNLIFCLTLFIFLLIPPLFLNAQEDEEEIEEEPAPQITASVSPQIPVTGRTFTISLVIDYPVPEEVTVIAPLFADSFILDRIVKTPRVTETQVFTVVEYRLIPLRSGRVTLESFTVVCPVGVRESDTFTLNVRTEGEEPRILVPRLVWEGNPRQMEAGERVTLVLRAGGWNSRQPPPEFFMPPVPQGVILALLPLSEDERDGGIAVKLTLIALEPGNFRLSTRTIRYETVNENVIFSIPALSIQITGSSVVRRSLTDEQLLHQIDDNSAGDEAVMAASFPDFILTAAAKSGVREKQRLQCEDIYNTAKELWESGFYAESLAHLRRGERDHPAGALLQPIRRQAEENLGVFLTENENRQRRKLLSALFSIILFIVIIAPFVCLFLIKKRNSGQDGAVRMKLVLICAIVFSAAFSFFFYRLSDSSFVFHGKGSLLGVTKETSVRRMADIEGEGLFSFREGQPVVILLNSGFWVYVRANDASSLSGWIQAEDVVFY